MAISNNGLNISTGLYLSNGLVEVTVGDKTMRMTQEALDDLRKSRAATKATSKKEKVETVEPE